MGSSFVDFDSLTFRDALGSRISEIEGGIDLIILNGVSTNFVEIQRLADPTTDNSAANKKYVDNTNNTGTWKSVVRVATTVNGAFATAFANGQTIDGVSIATNDRILIKNQDIGSQNGIYIAQASGSPIRASDLLTSSPAAGTSIYVNTGSVNGGVIYICSNSIGSDTVGTDSLNFSSFGVSTDIGNWKFTGNNAGISLDLDLIQLATNLVTITGNLDATAGLDVTGAVLTTAVGITNTAGEVLISGGNLQLNDNIVLSLGTGDDLQIVHNITDTIVTSTTGNLLFDNTNVTGSTQFDLGTDTSATTFEIRSNNGTVLFSVNGAGVGTISNWIFTGNNAGIATDLDLIQLATNLVTITGNLDATAGLDVTGAVLTTAVGITNTAGEVLISGGNLQLNDNIVLSLGTGDDLQIVHNGTISSMVNTTGELLIENTAVNNDVVTKLGDNITATNFRVKNSDNTAVFSVPSTGNGQILGRLYEISGVSTVSVAANYTYTAAEFTSGLLQRDPAGSNRTDTTPTAAELVAEIPNATAGLIYTFYIRNPAANNRTQLTAGVGVTLDGNSSTYRTGSETTSTLLVHLDNVNPGTEAVTIYALGKDVF